MTYRNHFNHNYTDFQNEETECSTVQNQFFIYQYQKPMIQFQEDVFVHKIIDIKFIMQKLVNDCIHYPDSQKIQIFNTEQIRKDCWYYHQKLFQSQKNVFSANQIRLQSLSYLKQISIKRLTHVNSENFVIDRDIKDINTQVQQIQYHYNYIFSCSQLIRDHKANRDHSLQQYLTTQNLANMQISRMAQQQQQKFQTITSLRKTNDELTKISSLEDYSQSTSKQIVIVPATTHIKKYKKQIKGIKGIKRMNSPISGPPSPRFASNQKQYQRNAQREERSQSSKVFLPKDDQFVRPLKQIIAYSKSLNEINTKTKKINMTISMMANSNASNNNNRDNLSKQKH